MLEISDITKTFNPGTPNEVRALRNVSLRLETGSFLVIIGTNGSGKSTLLNAVAGTFFVDAGSIAVAGRNITRWAEHQRAGLIGRVFQNPFSGTAPNMSIAENLALAARRGQPRGLGWALHRKLREELRDLQGAERARVRPEDLLQRFDEVRRREQLDATVAEMLQRNYV